MEFGVFNSLYVPQMLVDEWGEGAEHRRFMDEVDYTLAADQNGFKYTWATEHHFLKEYSHLSANESFLGYIAGRTERIHIGSGIFNITPPVNHPVRIAERAAVLDHLSLGRFELGMGRGSSTTEQTGFGIDDPELTREMFGEVVRELPKMWADGKYSYDGRFFSMPPRTVLPKPFTKPHPPMWVAAGSPGTFKVAAQLGIGVLCFTTGTPDSLAPLIEIYKTEIEKCDNPAGGYINNNVMVTSQMLCLENRDRVVDIASHMTSGYQNSLVFRYLDTFPKPDGVPSWPNLIPEPTPEQIDAAIRSGDTCMGTPDDVEKAIRRYESAGADQLTFGMLSTTMPIEVCIEAIETFGKHIIPLFDKDPVHSTTRQREQQTAKV
jgi:alkanesulfonate monooxygenase SsuD/methylene tetrahydromethanopterin reductase-like flavin-dependent oxidoreductase (luciferase family)